LISAYKDKAKILQPSCKVEWGIYFFCSGENMAFVYSNRIEFWC